MRDLSYAKPLTRRATLLGAGVGISASALSPLAGARFYSVVGQTPKNPPTDVLTRPIPSTGEMLPAIGLGTFLTFDVIPGQPRDKLRAVMQAYWDGGARLVDTSPLYGSGETTVGDFATSMGIANRLFVANKVWATGEYLADDSHILRSLELSESRLWRSPIDLMQCHSLVNVDVVLPNLRALKKAKRIRYTGVSHHENLYHPALMAWIEKGDLDFVQLNYSIFNRAAEDRLLPMARQRGVAVNVNMPFEKARLFKIVEGRDLPAFAREFGAESWAAFFLKYVLSHPAVTCALPATSNPAHAAQNVAALKGPLPDSAMRRRMVAHMETIPGFSDLASMPWYPGKRYMGLIGRSQAELRARS